MAKCASVIFRSPCPGSPGCGLYCESEVLTQQMKVSMYGNRISMFPLFAAAAIWAKPARIGEGAAMIRTKGEAGTGNIVEAVRHMRTVQDAIRKLTNMPQEELMAYAKEIGAPFALVQEVHDAGKLPVVNFAAGGVATPADASL